jgi:phosphatidylinositol alpha-1,6-mannosyltransferase
MAKTLLITLEFAPDRGGVATYYSQMCEHMAPDSVVVLAPTTSVSQHHVRFPIVRDWRLTNLKKRGWFISSLFHHLSAYRLLRDIIKQHQVNRIIVGNVLPLGTIVQMYAKRYDIPYVVITHGLDILAPQQSNRKKKLLQRILGDAKAVVANSHFTRDEIVKLGIDHKKISIVHPCPATSTVGVDYELIEALRQQYKLVDTRILLSVGRLVERKGFDQVLLALPDIIKRQPNTRYVIVGDGPDRARLEKLCLQKNLGNHVIWIGSTDDATVSAWYQLSDILVMPSRQIGPDVEGFGIVYLEANLHGKPVVAGRSGGIPDAVVHGVTGLLINPTDTTELTQAIVSLLQDAGLAHRLGIQGMNRVLTEFNWADATKKIARLLS